MVGARTRPAVAAAFLLAAGCSATGGEASAPERQAAGAPRGAAVDAGAMRLPPPLGPDETGVAILCGKVLTLDDEDRVFDPGMILASAGRLDYVGPPAEVPAGYRVLRHPDLWASPGMVDLHTHIHSTGFGDTNDMVKPVNPELRVRPAMDPWEPQIARGTAGGVTTVFGIPGSGTSLSGFGMVYKTKTSGGYEEMVVRDPGGLKVAFNYNPQNWGGPPKPWCSLSWTLEHLNDRAAALARDEARDGGEDWQLEDLKRVHAGELPVLVHCASAEGVAGTVRMWKGRYDTTCVVSHGSWDGHLAGAYAAEMGVPVNHGPRTMNFLSARREGRIQGGAQSYVDAGVPLFSLNTDSPIVPQEELFLQATGSARLGADAYGMLRAVTTHPADSFMLGERVGSLEVGKDADVVISTGDPIDPRSRVELVLIDGEVHYSRLDNGQVF